MSSGVAGMRTKMVRRWHWPAVRSTLELLRLGKLGRQVKTGVWQEPWRRYWRPSAVAGEIESWTRVWSLPRSIQGRCHADSDIPLVYRYVVHWPHTVASGQDKHIKQYTISRSLFSLGFVEMIPSPQLGFIRGVFLANHLASTDNLTRTIKRQNT